MMLSINVSLAFACFLSASIAYPSTEASAAFPPYKAPGPNDVRSPCPGLNSLANHGFIPHNGRGNTLPILIKGLAAGLNMGADFTAAIGGAGLLSNPKQNALNPFFDLDHLALHNFPIEHDFSLSRQDAFFGDNKNFNQTIWDMILAYVPEGQDFNIENGAKARYNRVKVEKARDPDFTYLPQTFVFSYGETALYLSTMGSSPVKGVAPRKYVQSMFEKERLPYELGWKPSALPITLASLAAMALELNAATGEPLPEGLTITESTLKTTFEGLNPVTGLLGNIGL